MLDGQAAADIRGEVGQVGVDVLPVASAGFIVRRNEYKAPGIWMQGQRQTQGLTHIESFGNAGDPAAITDDCRRVAVDAAEHDGNIAPGRCIHGVGQGDIVRCCNQVKTAVSVFLFQKLLIALTVFRRGVALGIHPFDMENRPLGLRAPPCFKTPQDVVLPAVSMVIREQHQNMLRFLIRSLWRSAQCHVRQADEQGNQCNAIEAECFHVF